jgi:hypothetical protein
MPDPDPQDPPANDPPPDQPDRADKPDENPETEVKRLTSALNAERKARAVAEREASKLRDATATDAEKAVAAAKEAGRAEALKEMAGRLVETEVRAAAAGKLADPADAVRLLDLAEFLGDDGTIDRDAITSAIGDLVESKPYLAADSKGGSNGHHKAPQGTRPGAAPEADGDAFLRNMVRGH